ncbi:hypothetical protein [Ruminococcus sp.]|uniref:hypothetical protein n=1 Tax=Ruminococcus sp. TaxID=41978 RepID=UPI0025CCAA0E|nr:hypothetical protein [Ruminococcus sp.]
MKKNKRIIAALMSAVTTISLSANLTANAMVDGRTSERFAELLEGYGYPYSRIEDASALEIQEYEIERGAVYYINEIGQVIAVKQSSPYVVIKMLDDADEKKLNEAIAEKIPNTKVEKGVAYNTDGVIIKEIEISSQTGDEISLLQAKELFSIVKDDIIGYDYISALYRIGHPQYEWRENTDGTKRQHFTSYFKCNDKKDEIQAVIDEDNLPCHIEELSDKIIDVVFDTQMNYLDEIAAASKITNATGAKCIAVTPETVGEKIEGSKIDIYNSINGDANCDKQMDMSDVVLIMQTLANPNKYQLSTQGSYNADLDDNGITVGDAQAIQEKLLGIN